jgi:hypothetical protein
LRGHIQVTFYNRVRADQLDDVLFQGLDSSLVILVLY